MNRRGGTNVDLDGLAAAAEAHYRAGRLAEAEAACRRLAGLLPGHAMAHYNFARVLKDRGKTVAAIAALRRALELDPAMGDAWLNLGNWLIDSGETDQAAAAFAHGLAARPGHWPLLLGLARADLARGRGESALALLRQAHAAAPEAVPVLLSLAAALLEQGDPDAAAGLYHRVLILTPDLPEALAGAAHAARRGGDHAAALDYYQRACRVRPDDLALRARLAEARLGVCDWSGIARLSDDLVVPALACPQPVLGPIQALGLPFALPPRDSLALARRRADSVAAEAHALGLRRRVPPPGPRDRLTIGYLSADFHDHPTTHLMRGLFSAHDRDRVRVVALSLGRDDASLYRRAVREDSDLFVDLAPLDLSSAVAAIVAAGIDILVDINVHTRGNRLHLTAARPAPVSVNWLGLPGSSGAGFIDWALVDRVVAPPGAEAAFRESLLVMPHCYQPNDGAQPIAAEAPGRAESGLPATGVVFCCFNQAFKIEPVMFACWMRILARVPGSVLWLLQGPAPMADNLRRAAAGHGIDPARLVFAPRLSKPRHLARHRLADLGLDTLFYNAHTTASDALWAGVPWLTVPGTAFAARVAASLLTAVGLPELICEDLAAFEARAVALAGDRAALAGLRDRLAAARTTAPLFDTARFARDLERGYHLIWREARAGRRPRRLDIPAED